TRRDERHELGALPLAALLPEPHAHAVAGRRQRHIDGPSLPLGDTVAAHADMRDGELDLAALRHHDARAAAMRNSTLPLGPWIGLSVTPCTCQPGCAASHATIRSQTSRCSAGSRTTPPLPTRPLPTSNCGLMSATRRADGAASAGAAGSPVSRP